jgi:hypothetical protein
MGRKIGQINGAVSENAQRSTDGAASERAPGDKPVTLDYRETKAGTEALRKSSDGIDWKIRRASAIKIKKIRWLLKPLIMAGEIGLLGGATDCIPPRRRRDRGKGACSRLLAKEVRTRKGRLFRW